MVAAKSHQWPQRKQRRWRSEKAGEYGMSMAGENNGGVSKAAERDWHQIANGWHQYHRRRKLMSSAKWQ
jgi:hypothetical protein